MSNKYPEYILKYVRQNLGLDDPTDKIKDDIISNMTKDEVLERVCNWNGLINYHNTIKGWIEDIYGIDLTDK